MADDELKYLASAILLGHANGTFSRVTSPTDIEYTVTKAEKLREEIIKSHRQRGQQYQPGMRMQFPSGTTSRKERASEMVDGVRWLSACSRCLGPRHFSLARGILCQPESRLA